jgi:hypothetical protein
MAKIKKATKKIKRAASKVLKDLKSTKAAKKVAAAVLGKPRSKKKKK